jgi:hypothetical protein
VHVLCCAVLCFQGGVRSEGMLCDSPMLGWVGGAKGVVQQVPDEWRVGGAPPAARPQPVLK